MLQEQHVFLKMRQPGLYNVPHPMCYGIDLDSEATNLLNHMMVTNCALCSKPFLLHNIIVANYRHLYHPWCPLIHFRSNQTCANGDCPTIMLAAWQKKFGFNEVNFSKCSMEDLDISEETCISEISTRQQRALENCLEVGEFSFHPTTKNIVFCTNCSFTFVILHFQKY